MSFSGRELHFRIQKLICDVCAVIVLKGQAAEIDWQRRQVLQLNFEVGTVSEGQNAGREFSCREGDCFVSRAYVSPSYNISAPCVSEVEVTRRKG